MAPRANSLGTARVLEALAVFREYVLRVLSVSRGSVNRIFSVLPSSSCFDTAGTYLPVLLGFGTAYTLSILSAVGPSQYSLYI